MPTVPTLLTFDIFGTVVDWRRGLREALWRKGVQLDDALFERILADQEKRERERFEPYRDITARSLEQAARLSAAKADEIAAGIGSWPLYPDSAAALGRLLARYRCVATTNSDRLHRREIEEQLGVRMSAWICAEDLRLYKPDERFWRHVAERLDQPLSAAWWHVSAYADYDLEPARRLGLTTVFVARPHARPGVADHRVTDLSELATALGA
jgi:2-haloalkanoic acid dehalogenase type II